MKNHSQIRGKVSKKRAEWKAWSNVVVVLCAILLVVSTLFLFAKNLKTQKVTKAIGTSELEDVGDSYSYDSEEGILYLSGVNWEDTLTLENDLKIVLCEGLVNIISSEDAMALDLNGYSLEISGEGEIEFIGNDEIVISTYIEEIRFPGKSAQLGMDADSGLEEVEGEVLTAEELEGFSVLKIASKEEDEPSKKEENSSEKIEDKTTGDLTPEKVKPTVSGGDKTITYSKAPYDVTKLFVLNGLSADYAIVSETGTGELEGSMLSVEESGDFVITATTRETSEYLSTSITQTLSVEKREVDAKFSNLEFIYNGEVQEIEASFKDVNEEEVKLKVTAGREFKNAGKYTVSLDLEENGVNYKLKQTEFEFEIKPREITVSINNKSSYRGEEVLALDYEITGGGVVTGDELNITLSCEVTKESGVGEYAITGTCENSNYAVTFTKGKYTITERVADVESSGLKATDFPDETPAPASNQNILEAILQVVSISLLIVLLYKEQNRQIKTKRRLF